MVLARVIWLHHSDFSHLLAVEAQQLIAAELETELAGDLGNVIRRRCSQNGLLEGVVILHSQDERPELIESHGNHARRQSLCLGLSFLSPMTVLARFDQEFSQRQLHLMEPSTLNIGSLPVLVCPLLGLRKSHAQNLV